MHRRFLIFSFLSGVSALIYEIMWVRILTVAFGSTTYSVSTVLAVFMAGLAIGNRVFGQRIDRSSNPLKTYALIELCLAFVAAVIAFSIPTVHSLMAAGVVYVPPSVESLARIVLASLMLLPPAILMGGPLPVLSQCIAERNRSGTSESAGNNDVAQAITRMYGLNTLGAVVGCTASGFLFVPWFGIQRSILLAATLNGLIGVMAWRHRHSCVIDVSHQRDLIPPLAAMMVPRRHATRDTVLVFVAGFVALATEVVWTRLLINQLSGNVLIFSMILAAFLAGMGIAGIAVGRWIRGKHADGFVAILFAINGVWLLVAVFFQIELGQLFDWIHRTGVGQPQWTTLLCLFALFVILLPATVSLGSICPWLLAMQTAGVDRSNGRTVGDVVGRLLSWNTIGAICGSLVAGFVMLNTLGAIRSVFVLAMVCFVTSLISAIGKLQSVVGIAGAVLCVAGLMSESHRQPVWFNAGFTRVRRLPDENTRFFAEDAEGTVVVTADNDALRLLVNGVVVADSSREDMWDLLLKAHLPMLLHPDPKRVAVVGLGAGISLGAIESYDEVEVVDCIELCSEVVGAHRCFQSFNERCWEDPRLHLYIDDGRHFLMKSRQASGVANPQGGYDVINVDPIDPPVCNQYTQEFVQVCYDRLNDGGLVVQWIPLFHLQQRHLRSMSASFIRVFPNSTMWYDGTSILLIGCKGKPLTTDVHRFVSRGRRDRVRENLAVIGRPDPLILLGTFVCGPEQLHEWVGQAAANTDDRPWLEYELLLAGPLRRDAFLQNLISVRSNFEPMSTVASASVHTETAMNVRETMSRLLNARIEKIRGNHEHADQIIDSAQNDFGLTDSVLETLAPLLTE